MKGDAEAFLIFGESGMGMYALNTKANRYEIVDKVSLDSFGSFGTFDELFVEALTMRL